MHSRVIIYLLEEGFIATFLDFAVDVYEGQGADGSGSI